ncbi:MAG: hypothetical protein ABS43_07560 [Bordetella sp. SCN 67-23]|nr:response regulator [Burkholderiales bacterium]ODS74994.1 MAG: hypothetical protein ABS43_07560 [Bordetella sp. SCN 67-23]ODU76854.1 MAG: hypothetical protein ABT00_14825 [Bordetella sp. SCN 68-11]OJW89376.1 MAG: hypothetical protein BGO71_19040 [Burkholderiales bacterium 67-32]
MPLLMLPAALRSNSLQRDLIRLGVLPCATAAVALTLWFTHERLDALEQAFRANGAAIARQLAVASDLSLYAGDVETLRDLAENMVAKGIASRVEIGNGTGIDIAAGPGAEKLKHARPFAEPVRLRATRGLTDYPRPGGPALDIGTVRVFLDDAEHRSARAASMLAGGLIGGTALLLAWLSARHMARAVARPLKRISATVSSLQGGKLDARCGPCGRNEIAALASDVDHMAQRLQDAYSSQEERIQAATREALARLSQAEQATRSRTRFLATASHDLRQPVHAMGLFIDGLLPTASAAQLPAMQRLQEGTQVMSALLDALLDISRLDANVLSPSYAPVRVRDLFEQLDAMHGAVAREAGVDLVWRDRGRAVMTDASLVMRVLDNLVRNAVRHGEGGRVLVAARRDGAGTRIEVRDNGIGVAPIQQSRIFEEFYQVANPQRDRRNGFGLGLSICARIARLLRTDICVRSALRRGSTFSLLLPTTDAPPVAPLAAAPEATGTTSLDLDCLLIDDDEAILEGTAHLLRQWNCRVDQARTADDALRKLRDASRRYDVILCDLQLGDSDDGLALLLQARELRPRATAIMISGTTTPDILQRIRETSVTLLTKPVAPAKLRALLGRWTPAGRSARPASL